jgi:diaminopimelate dehydrogenase
MTKIPLAIVGFGNLGRYALEAAQAEPDLAVSGVIDPAQAGRRYDDTGARIVARIDDLAPFAVALLCVPTLQVPEIAPRYLARGIATVDAFDLHGAAIADLQQNLDRHAKTGGCAAISAAGWDPGIDSLLRAVLKIVIPRGNTFTNYGPGMSLGHSVAARTIPGVKDAVALTYPLGYGKHRRQVYITPEPGADVHQLEQEIHSHRYFAGDETTVTIAENLAMFRDHGHGAHIERKGLSGRTHNQRVACDIVVNNPAATSQVMVCAARAARRCQPGAYTMLDLPLNYFLAESAREAARELA